MLAEPSRFPFIVLDVNMLRDDTMLEQLSVRCNQQQLELLLPDAVGYEQCKNFPHAFETIRGSLMPLSKYSHLVCVCRRLPDMGREEIDSRTPITSIVEQPATEILRDALSRLSRGDDAVLKAMLTIEFEKRVQASNEIWKDHERIRDTLKELGKQLKVATCGDLLSRLRSSDQEKQDNALIELLSSQFVMNFAYQALKRKDIDDVSAIKLLSASSMEVRFLLGLLSVAAIWLAKGGLESAKGEKLSNDLTDMEYAIMGSVCAEFATRDGKSKTTSKLIANAHTAWRTKLTSLIS